MIEYTDFCFLADQDIFEHHHGVRRYLFGLLYALKTQGQKVEVWVAHTTSKGAVWKRLVIKEYELKNNGFSGNRLFAKGNREIRNKLSSELWGSKEVSIFNFWEFDRSIYNLNEMEAVGICILAAPWVKNHFVKKPECKKFYSLAMDAIPNRYYFSEPNNMALLNFSHQHMLGYKYADEEGDGILCISEATARQCTALGFGRIHGNRVLPVVLPPGYDGILNEDISRERSRTILLAAPFDRRKGMLAMPALINAGQPDSILIYGRARCEPKELLKFFESLEIENIEWWMDVDVEMQIELYKRSKLLLFPSLNEGLGLPVIEAYACGTSVLVSDISPLNDISLNEDILSKNDNEAMRKVEMRLNNPINPNFYHSYSIEKWGMEKLKMFKW